MDRSEENIVGLAEKHESPRCKNLLKERIVILDGAMGTMVQAQQLDEAEYRGAQFRESPEGPAAETSTC